MRYAAFISYRRVGGAGMAELVKNALTKRGYNERQIFIDTQSAKTGNYIQTIDEAIAETRNFIVIITRNCFCNLDENGIWVHELRRARDLRKNIIPIYFDGIEKISPEYMPDSIIDFPLSNAVIYSEKYAEASWNKMMDFMVGRKPIQWGKIIMRSLFAALMVWAVLSMAIINKLQEKVQTPIKNEPVPEVVETPVPKLEETPASELDEPTAPKLDETPVEFSILLSLFAVPHTFPSWATFANMSGFNMISDVVVIVGEGYDSIQPFYLEYSIHLTVAGKPVSKNAWGNLENQCSLCMYGPRVGPIMAELQFDYSGESTIQDIPAYLKGLYPNMSLVYTGENKTRWQSEETIYQIREGLFVKITDIPCGNASESKYIYISSYYDKVAEANPELLYETRYHIYEKKRKPLE